MKRFKVDGLWSTTRDGTNLVPGFLRYGKSGLSLYLLGSFKGGWTPNAPGGYEKLYGVIGQGLEGNYATLFDCLTSSTTVNSSSVRSEKVQCGRAIIGDDLSPEEALRFESVEYSFTHLDEWVATTHIVSDLPQGENPEITIRYKQAEPISFPVDDFGLQVGFGANLITGQSKAIIREKSRIVIEPPGEGLAEEVGSRYLSQLQNFLTFATDNPNEFDRALLRGGRISYDTFDLPKRFGLYFTQAFRLKGPKKRLQEVEMLFTFNDVRHLGLNIFQKWFDFVRSHGPFVDVYFAHIYSPAKFLDYRFRNVITAFRLLCASSLEVTERTRSFLRAIEEAATAYFDGSERAWLAQSLPTGHDVEMPFQLMESLNQNSEVMSLLIDDFHGFVTAVCRTLEYSERRTPERSGPIIQGSNLYFLVEKLRWLIKLLVLKQLGFKDSQILTLFNRNINFTFLKSR